MHQEHAKPMSLSIFTLLYGFRRKPEVYFGEVSLEKLRAYVDGYQAGTSKCGFWLKDLDLFRAFEPWLKRKLPYSGAASSWCQMILETEKSDTAAFHRFFKLLDEYCYEQKLEFIAP